MVKIMENPIKQMDDLGVIIPIFGSTSICMTSERIIVYRSCFFGGHEVGPRVAKLSMKDDLRIFERLGKHHLL